MISHHLTLSSQQPKRVQFAQLACRNGCFDPNAPSRFHAALLLRRGGTKTASSQGHCPPGTCPAPDRRSALPSAACTRFQSRSAPASPQHRAPEDTPHNRTTPHHQQPPTHTALPVPLRPRLARRRGALPGPARGAGGERRATRSSLQAQVAISLTRLPSLDTGRDERGYPGSKGGPRAASGKGPPPAPLPAPHPPSAAAALSHPLLPPRLATPSSSQSAAAPASPRPISHRARGRRDLERPSTGLRRGDLPGSHRARRTRVKPPPAATAGSRDRPSPIRRGQGKPLAVGQQQSWGAGRVSRGRWGRGAARSSPARARLCLPGAASSAARHLPALEEPRAWPGEGRVSRDYCGDPAATNGTAWCGRRLLHRRWLCERRRLCPGKACGEGQRAAAGPRQEGMVWDRRGRAAGVPAFSGEVPSAESVCKAGLGGISHFKSFTR